MSLSPSCWDLRGYEDFHKTVIIPPETYCIVTEQREAGREQCLLLVFPGAFVLGCMLVGDGKDIVVDSQCCFERINTDF